MAAEPSFLHRLLNWNKKSAPETVEAEQYAEAFGQFKKLLLEQYQIRIQAKTAKRLPINLTAKPTHFGTSPERAALYFDDLTIESEDIATEIDKILNTHQRLLIIGDPGVGKTTILLYAAINILLFTKEQKLPLILNLATWQVGRNFREWYAQNIAHTYNLSLTFVNALLQRNAVVPFFDGFDEISEDSREDCFRNMAAYFGAQRSHQLIVSSRKKEYAACKADAPVYAEIEVQPLSIAQIKKSLEENGKVQSGDLALLRSLGHDKWLSKAIETPFYLNTASFLFAKDQRVLSDFHFTTDSVEGRQAELLESFVGAQTPKERDRKYLAFIARKMEAEDFLLFELVKMQQGWCRSIWRYFFILSLVFGLFLSILFCLYAIFSFRDGVMSLTLVESLGLGLGVGMTSGLIFGFAADLGKPKITTSDIQIWRWYTFAKNWRKSFNWFLRAGLAGGLIMGGVPYLFMIFIIAISFSNSGIVEVFMYQDLRNGVFKPSFIAGLCGGLISGLIFGLRKAGITNRFLLHLPSPYQRFWATFRSGFWEMLVVGMFFIFGVLWALKDFSFEKLLSGIVQENSYMTFLFFCLPVALLLTFAKSQFLQHFSLRLVLYFESKLPLRLVTFLDRMTDHHIFEDNRRTIKGKKQRGATWRFRHKILQDYFAGLGEPAKNPTFVFK